MLARRSGILEISTDPRSTRARDYQLHLDRDNLLALFVDRRELTDTMLIRDAFRSLLDLEHGTFEFESVPDSQLRSSVKLPVKQLVLSTATIIDELANYRSRFPHPDIVFQVVTPVTEHLPGDLELFFIRAETQLRRGISASELAETLNLSVEEVQLHFYKLRSAGRLVPRRSYARQTQTAHRQQRTSERPRLLSRLLRSLSRIGRNHR